MTILRKLIGAVLLSACSPAFAVAVVDQHSLLPIGVSAPLIGVYHAVGSIPQIDAFDLTVTQTVTAGLSGRLEAVDFPFYSHSGDTGGSVRISLIDGDYGAGATDVVGSVIFDVPPLPSPAGNIWVNTAAFNYFVAPGSIYSIKFEPTVPSALFNIKLYAGIGEFSPPDKTVPYIFDHYADGSAYIEGTIAGAPLFQKSIYDLNFVSYVDTEISSAVPESSTWAMIFVGFGALGSALRLKRRTCATV